MLSSYFVDHCHKRSLKYLAQYDYLFCAFYLSDSLQPFVYFLFLSWGYRALNSITVHVKSMTVVCATGLGRWSKKLPNLGGPQDLITNSFHSSLFATRAFCKLRMFLSPKPESNPQPSDLRWDRHFNPQPSDLR